MDEIARLVGRSGDLKADLVEFARTKRFDRYREQELIKGADTPDGAPPPYGSPRWIRAMDDFIMTFRFPDGTGVIDRYLSATDLRASDRKLLRGWLDPVDGIFELRARDDDHVTLYNLIDEMEYRTYSSTGFKHYDAPVGSFTLARVVPLTDSAWILSGNASHFPREHAKVVAELALEWVQASPRLAFRNPAKAEQGWAMMREDQADFAEFFGADQVVFPPREALERLNAYYGARQQKVIEEKYPDGDAPAVAKAGIDEPFFTLSEEELGTMGTIGVVYDERDGMSLLPDFGLLEELFADPSLAAGAAGKRYQEALLGYLDSDSVYPGPLRRLAAAHPATVDEVYRTVLKKPKFTWDKQGEQLLRKRKPWYFRQERYPKTTPVSGYLMELLSHADSH